MTGRLTLRDLTAAALLMGLTLLPVYARLAGDLFLLTLFTRIVILALAAVSLNLILGFGGMMSFGHAAYLGIGGYAVGILAFEGVQSGFAQCPIRGSRRISSCRRWRSARARCSQLSSAPYRCARAVSISS